MAQGLKGFLEDVGGGIAHTAEDVPGALERVGRYEAGGGESVPIAKGIGKGAKGAYEATARQKGKTGEKFTKGLHTLWEGTDAVAPTAKLGPASIAYQQQQADKKAQTQAADPQGGFAGIAGMEKAVPKFAAAAPHIPSFQEEIDKALSTYVNELTNLGPEYGAEMAYLAPYVSGTSTLGTEQQIAKSVGGAGVKPYDPNSPFAQTMAGAESQLGQAYNNLPKPGFGDAAQAARASEQAVPYSETLQAALGYQKYLQTYGGLRPNTSGLPANVQSAYQDIVGNTGSSSGLPSPTAAAAANQATQLLTPPASTPGG